MATKKKKKTATFSAEERAAMKDLARERKAGGKGDGERDLKTRIAEMTPADRTLAERVDALVRAAAPSLAPKTWYGMPAWARADGKVVCFFQSGAKFKTRYCTFGFSHDAALDEGGMWPTAFALATLSAADEARITALVKKAVR